MVLNQIEKERDLLKYIESVDFDAVLKNEKVLKVVDIFKQQNISVKFNIDKSLHGYLGVCSEINLRIEVNVYDALLDMLKGYIRKGTFGDLYIPNTMISFKEDENALVYSLIFVLTHEYKHYLQFVNGEMNSVDTSFDFDDKSYGYKTDEAKELEGDADDFAMLTTFKIMRNNNFDDIINDPISIEELKGLVDKLSFSKDFIVKDEESSCPPGYGVVSVEDLPF